MVSSLSYRSFLKAYLLVLGVALVCMGLANLAAPNPWSMGDWLINYSGGFVRRGLIGQSALFLAAATRANIFLLIVIVQWVCYATLLWCVWIMLRGLAWSLWMILLVYSPATLSLILLNPGAAYRKEIIFLAILSLAIVLSDRVKLNGIMGQVMIPAAVFIAVLSHEALAFFLPYLFALYLIRIRSSLVSGLVALIPVTLAGAIALLIAARHPGDAASASAICSSIGEKPNPALGLCKGAISYLSHDMEFARRDVIYSIHYWHFIYQAPYIFILAAVPVWMGFAKLWRIMRFECKILAFCSALAWIGSFPLFYYGSDWDRWMSVHTFSSMMLLLLIEGRRQKTELGGTMSWRLPTPPLRRYAAIASIAFMTFGWQCAFTHHFPVPFDRLRDYIIYEHQAIRNSTSENTAPFGDG